ncbi:hypothetical protein D1871_09430 [Nakamurella silvestris]|nr:hypothetical protein D1871_09430 [Nakamurella silvestris]
MVGPACEPGTRSGSTGRGSAGVRLGVLVKAAGSSEKSAQEVSRMDSAPAAASRRRVARPVGRGPAVVRERVGVRS